MAKRARGSNPGHAVTHAQHAAHCKSTSETRGVGEGRTVTGVLYRGGVWGASPNGVRGGAPRRNFCVFEAKNRQFRLPKCPQTSLPFMSTRKSSPGKEAKKSQDRPSASRPPAAPVGSARPSWLLPRLHTCQHAYMPHESAARRARTCSNHLASCCRHAVCVFAPRVLCGSTALRRAAAPYADGCE